MKKYKKNETVSAVQINLELTKPLHYNKWGDIQTAKEGDWLINNNGETYTCDKTVFEHTYEEVSKGEYRKIAIIIAEQATEDGTIKTLEGFSEYKAGDFIVTNPDGDQYPIQKDKFLNMYTPA